MKTLRLILWDHLTHDAGALKEVVSEDKIVLLESRSEFGRIYHHKKKLIFFIAAMRYFALELQAKGYNVRYEAADEQPADLSFSNHVKSLYKQEHPDRILVMIPGEYRLYQALIDLKNQDLPIEIVQDDRFLSTPKEFTTWAYGKKELRMEFFYRLMRVKYNILMEEGKPLGGSWNYDKENRSPPIKGLKIPSPTTFSPDAIVQKAQVDVERMFKHHFGDHEGFSYAVTRAQALDILKGFIKERLPFFGTYQDAMLENEPWMYHSHLSFYLNIGLLLPKECIDLAQMAYERGDAPLHAVEGFIRQILGWREYVRGIYWLMMPSYAQENYLNASRDLPSFYWDAQTPMNCIKQCVTQTKEHAYAHHIQRLMVLGNFALLAGIDPNQVNEWYWIVYADAHEWVELPNVSGMILFADGGYLASKPYAASGAYINKMSNYCQNCYYNVQEKIGERACPFNSLYWNFLEQNKEKLKNNQRLKIVYASLNKMDASKKEAIIEQAQGFLKTLKPYDRQSDEQDVENISK